MSTKINKLNSWGIVRHILIPLLAITMVASFGAYKVFFSKAATSFDYANVDPSQLFAANTPDGCWLAGRVWEPKTTTTGKGNNKKTFPPHCTQKCRYGGDAIKRPTDLYSYCPKALAPDITPAVCVNELHRRFVHNVGCARRVDNNDTNGAAQCVPGYPNYNQRANLPDICVAHTIANAPTQAPKPAPQAQAAKPAPQAQAARPAQGNQTNQQARPAQGNQANQQARPAQGNQANQQARPAQGNQANQQANHNNRQNQPKCANGSTPDKHGKCKKEVIKNQAPASSVVAVNSKIDRKDCLLLGREWQPGNNQGQPRGCSKVSCNNSSDKIAVNAGKTVCVDSATNSMYAVHLGKNVCNNLNRQWINEVGLCAKLPNNGSPNTVVSAAQCTAPFTTYVIKTGDPDKCRKPTVANRATSVAKSTVKVAKNTVNTPRKVACNQNKNNYWDNGKCKKKRVSKAKKNKSNNKDKSNNQSDDEEADSEDEGDEESDESGESSDEAYDIDDICANDGECSTQVAAAATPAEATQDGQATANSQTDDNSQELSESDNDTDVDGDYDEEGSDSEEYDDSEEDSSYDEYGECTDESECSDEAFYDESGEELDQEATGESDSEEPAKPEETSNPDNSTASSDQFIEPEKDPTVIVPVSNTLSKYQCVSLLGREWVKKTASGQEEGCSMKTCHDSKDKLSKESRGKYCISTKYKAAYGTTNIDKQNCAKLNRKYIVPVKVCAQNPNQSKPGRVILKAPQCLDDYSTYKVVEGDEDKCVPPSTIQKLRGSLSSTGSTFNRVFSIGPYAVCKAKNDHYWDGQSCKVLRKNKVHI